MSHNSFGHLFRVTGIPNGLHLGGGDGHPPFLRNVAVNRGAVLDDLGKRVNCEGVRINLRFVLASFIQIPLP